MPGARQPHAGGRPRPRRPRHPVRPGWREHRGGDGGGGPGPGRGRGGAPGSRRRPLLRRTAHRAGAVWRTAGIPIGVVEAIAAPHDLRVTLMGAQLMRAPRQWTSAETHSPVLPRAWWRWSGSPASRPSGTIVGHRRRRPRRLPRRHQRRTRRRRDLRRGRPRRDLEARTGRWRHSDDGYARSRARRGLYDIVTAISRDVPAACEPARRRSGAWRRARRSALPYRRMNSGAFHDAMILGAEVPDRDDLRPESRRTRHHPDEYTAPEDLDRGVAVLREDARPAHGLDKQAPPGEPSGPAGGRAGRGKAKYHAQHAARDDGPPAVLTATAARISTPKMTPMSTWTAFRRCSVSHSRPQPSQRHRAWPPSSHWPS